MELNIEDLGSLVREAESVIYRPILSDQLHGCVESILQSRQYQCVHIYTGEPPFRIEKI